MITFEELLEKKSIIKNKEALSPSYVPDYLPYREEQINEIIKTTAPLLKGKKTNNILIYGKTGTGKTSVVKFVMRRFNETAKAKGLNAMMVYANARVYNSLYKIMQRILGHFDPEVQKSGYSVSYLYELLTDKVNNMGLAIIIDEIDMVKDLDDLIYTLTRINEDIKGAVGLILISNKLFFKSSLDPRSLSSLNEKELIFPPYNAIQLRDIIKERTKIALAKDAITEEAISLIAAIAAQENGDARYALRLLHKAVEVAEDENAQQVSSEHVKKAKDLVEYDLAAEVIKTLPLNQQILLYAIAKLSLSPKQKFIEGADGYLFSGEVYNFYSKISKAVFHRNPKSARWYREYINELESLGLISTVFTSKGIRGHTRLIKLGLNPNDVIRVIEKITGIK